MGKQYFPVTFLSRKKYHFFFLTIIHFCLKHCMHGLRRREKKYKQFNWQYYLLILYLNLLGHIVLQVYCCYDPASFTQFTLPVDAKYCTVSLIIETKHMYSLIYFTASKFKMQSESFPWDFKKLLLRKLIMKVVIFSLMLFFCN